MLHFIIVGDSINCKPCKDVENDIKSFMDISDDDVKLTKYHYIEDVDRFDDKIKMDIEKYKLTKIPRVWLNNEFIGGKKDTMDKLLSLI